MRKAAADDRPGLFLLVVGWLFFAAVVIIHTQSHEYDFPWFQIDEQAHYAYTVDLITHHHWWADFNSFTMINPDTGKTELNYVNHPPQFYWLMKLVQLAFPHADPVRYRIPSLLFY